MPSFPACVETIEKPVGGVSELCEDDELSGPARTNAVRFEALLDQLGPFRRHVLRIREHRLDSGEEASDGPSLLPTGLRRFGDNLAKIALCFVLVVRIALIAGLRDDAAKPVLSTTE